MEIQLAASTGRAQAPEHGGSDAGDRALDAANHPTGSAASTAREVEVVCAIPARYASQRLPGKPLRMLAGQPMIQHVVERAQIARGVSRVVVLTDDERIRDAVADFGGEVEMTPAECTSGTDRIAWAARRWQPENAGQRRAVINVQGDEPLIEPSLVAQLADHLRANPGDEMVTAASPLGPEDAAAASNVKVVTDTSGYALYFSRAAIPHPQLAGHQPSAAAPYRLHIGIYGYRSDVLERLASLEPTPLERTESLEQLRALEHGIKIRVLEVDRPTAFGVDTEEDLDRAAALLAGQPH